MHLRSCLALKKQESCNYQPLACFIHSFTESRLLGTNFLNKCFLLILGIPGHPGPQGPSGPPGRNGLNGIPGAKGERGLQGITGRRGKKGSPGIPGVNGTNGQPGFRGKQGPRGVRGAVGPAGLNGAKGERGEPGERGPPGEQRIIKACRCLSNVPTQVMHVTSGFWVCDTSMVGFHDVTNARGEFQLSIVKPVTYVLHIGGKSSTLFP